MIRCFLDLFPNKTFRLAAVLLFAATVSGCMDSSPRPRGNASLPVLSYHAISDHPSSAYDISKNSFQKQIQYLKRNGYHTISLDEFKAWMAGKNEPAPQAVLITFDDANTSDYETAYPILKQNGFVGTLFITSKFLDTPGRLSTEQLKEMIQNGFSVGSHGLMHKSVVHLPEISMNREIRDSKLELEQKLHINIEYFAYPSGYFDPHARQVVRSSGYKGAFTVIPGTNNQKTGSYEIRRLLINQNINMDTFEKLLRGDPSLLAKFWQIEIPLYLQNKLFLPAEIEAQALADVDKENPIAQYAFKVLKEKR